MHKAKTFYKAMQLLGWLSQLACIVASLIAAFA